MRILMVTETFHPIVGGSESAIRYLSDALTDAGHQVMVAVMNVHDASSPSDKFAFRLLTPVVCGLNLRTWGKIRNCRKIIREFKPDVVNAHFLFESGMVGTLAAHAEGVPSVVSIRGRGIFYKPKNVLDAALSRWWIDGAATADGFLATSQEMADIAHRRHGLEVVAVSNGVETDLFHPQRKTDIRTPLGIRQDQKVIVCARRLVPKNGIEYMVRALPLIRRTHDAVLLLASPKNAEYEKLKALAESLGLADAVRFLGPVVHADLPAYFSSADAVVQPSIAEARSLACLEAMASGAAIVATDTGGLKELITHETNGILVPAFEDSTYQVGALNERGVADLAAAVMRVLSDAALSGRIRRGAREYAETCSWPAIAKQSLEIYGKAMEKYSKQK